MMGILTRGGRNELRPYRIAIVGAQFIAPASIAPEGWLHA